MIAKIKKLSFVIPSDVIEKYNMLIKDKSEYAAVEVSMIEAIASSREVLIDQSYMPYLSRYSVYNVYHSMFKPSLEDIIRLSLKWDNNGIWNITNVRWNRIKKYLALDPVLLPQTTKYIESYLSTLTETDYKLFIDALINKLKYTTFHNLFKNTTFKWYTRKLNNYILKTSEICDTLVDNLLANNNKDLQDSIINFIIKRHPSLITKKTSCSNINSWMRKNNIISGKYNEIVEWVESPTTKPYKNEYFFPVLEIIKHDSSVDKKVIMYLLSDITPHQLMVLDKYIELHNIIVDELPVELASGRDTLKSLSIDMLWKYGYINAEQYFNSKHHQMNKYTRLDIKSMTVNLHKAINYIIMYAKK